MKTVRIEEFGAHVGDFLGAEKTSDEDEAVAFVVDQDFAGVDVVHGG